MQLNDFTKDLVLSPQLARCGSFERVYPSVDSSKYQHFFENEVCEEDELPVIYVYISPSYEFWCTCM